MEQAADCDSDGLLFWHRFIEFCLTYYALFVIFLCIRRRAMRTTLDLPEDLVNEAMRATNIKTKTKVITVALEELVRKSKIGALKKFKGKMVLDIDLDVLRDRK